MMKNSLSIKFVTGALCAAVLAASLIASPLSIESASAQSAAPAATATPAKPDKAAKPAKPKKPPTAGQLAARERAKKCGAEWKAAKAAGKTEKGETWPKYWSACNKRLKSAG
jgi:hypothetical protein